VTKLTDKQKKLIIADYLECQNYREVARKHNKCVNTIRNVVNADKNIENKLTQKREENTEDILGYLGEQNGRIKRVLESLLRGIETKANNLTEKDNIRDLTTAYGIIVDKQLKWLEVQRGTGNSEQLTKVQELLSKLDEEARR
jgi:hypothetical protein